MSKIGNCAPFIIRLHVAVAAVILAIGTGWTQSTIISYQGFLANGTGGAMPDSTYTLGFALFETPVFGAALWSENAQVETNSGRFNHSLGSVVAIPRALLRQRDSLFLQISLEGQSLLPRTRLTTVPYAAVAGDLRSTDNTGAVAVATDPANRSLTLTDSLGDTTIILSGNVAGDLAVELPQDAVNSSEIIDEPGISIEQSITLVTLPTSEMVDLAVIEITIPQDGYIVLHGKCYAILSGTTGPNQARVQIDEVEGGAALFPYYTIAGLSGYVNTGDSYFPMYVTRTYFKQAGFYEFRLEGKADQNLPAVARTWDHILTAIYYPTQYENVKSTTLDPTGFPGAMPLPTDDSLRGYKSPPVFEVDLKEKAADSRSKK